MKAINYLYLTIILLTVMASSAIAQDPKPEGTPTAVNAPPKPQSPGESRAAMLRDLGLSREQLQQIRRVNVDQKPLMDAAQKRLREANIALDEAVYADQANDADFQARLKEAQMAQAEVIRLRSSTELAVRRVLTADQLVRFRELRLKFERARQEQLNRPAIKRAAATPDGKALPLRNFRNRPPVQQTQARPKP